MFLIGKMFIYLFLAGAVGGIAGWLFRNLQAQRTEESANRAAHDAKAKLPQLESLLRGRDEQITKLKDMLAENKTGFGEQGAQLRELEAQVKEAQREASRWQRSAQAAQGVSQDTSIDEFDIAADGVAGGVAKGSDLSGSTDQSDLDADKVIAELSQEISRLKEALAAKSAQLTAVGDTQSGDSTETESLLKMEMEALRSQLAAAEKELAALRSDLEQARNQVLELERERELQNKSLQVLHQQLELERTRRVANA